MSDTGVQKSQGFFARIWGFLRGYFVVVGVITTLSFALLIFAITQAVPGNKAPNLPAAMVLTLEFGDDIAEVPGPPSFDRPLFKRVTTLRDVTDALRTGAKDDRVKGFLARMRGPALSIAQIQELRAAIKVFRDAGKPAHIYAESFPQGMGAYYLAAAFDEIWMQPVGVVGITGIAAEMFFLKDLLGKVGVNPEFRHKGQYKSYPEIFTRTGMSDPNRMMMESLVGDLSSQIVQGIAEGRGLEKATIRKLIDTAPHTDTASLAAKLVTHLGYEDDLRKQVKTKAGIDDKGFVSLGDYAEYVAYKRKAAPKGGKVALIYGVGDVISHAEGSTGGIVMAADKIESAFRKAREDDNVKAVVFRIDSPGGSPGAAETILRAVIATKEKGIPVIVSMGSTAASGGYWAAASADMIVADPGTVTGSIGVFGGKMDMSALYAKLGVNWDAVTEGKNSRMWSSTGPFSESADERYDAMLQNIYDAFIERVAKGRGLTKEKVESVAQGRVWTGTQAKEQGLVDALGGLDVAADFARRKASLPADAALVEFPERKEGLDVVVSFLTGEDESALIPAVLHSAKAALQTRIDRENAVLRMPDVEIR